ncbi:UNVERIFIED_CONTAM: putative mitochondrial protein [Sesamum radiatum]|uniref:Mitochondrial protein n=1 Tax=Sesamum radiatum TaxID=300843 RepID=A0AAW2K8A2_SESRA
MDEFVWLLCVQREEAGVWLYYGRNLWKSSFNPSLSFTLMCRLELMRKGSAGGSLARVTHAESPYSDHAPLIIELHPTIRWNSNGSCRCFRFEAAWLQEPECETIVSNAWSGLGSSRADDRLGEKLALVSARLSCWERLYGRESREWIHKLERSIIERRSSEMMEVDRECNLRDKAELTKLILQEEIFWKQRSKVLWLKEGDRNSSFFHAKASHRHQTNYIRRLRNSDGSWTEMVEGIQGCILEYFQGVFTSCRPRPDDIESGTEYLPSVVNMEMTDDLLRPYTETETNHFLHTHSKGRQHFMNLKLDIGKAYDKVEWSFLRKVLGKLGFSRVFVDLIMLCVSSVSYSFVMSGSQFESITPQRGLRQGDPLSPYLFLLCTESFCSLFRAAAERRTISGVAFCRRAPHISHLLFADDTMVFCPANLSMQCLADVLGIRLENKHEIYLGLHAVVFRSKEHSLLPSKTVSGNGFRGGTRNLCLRQAKRSSSKQLCKRSPFMLCPAFAYQKHYFRSSSL